MSGNSPITRRTLLWRASTGAALLLGGGFALERVLSGGEDEGVRYVPGFNDDFLAYSESDFADATMAKVQDCGGVLLRFGVNWGEVQAAGPDSYDWSSSNRLYALALKFGLQLLPTLYGCPSWAEPTVTAARWTGNDPEYPSEGYRTCSPEHDADFGAFAEATLRHFDTFSKERGSPPVVAAVEIMNEPNVWTFGAVPATRLRELSSAAAEAVAASQAAGGFSRPMRVVSGGIAPVAALEPGNPQGYPSRPSWQEYLKELVADGPTPFDLGFHSYESSKPPAGALTAPEDNPSDPFARGREFVEWQTGRIIGRLDEALAIGSGDLWLTETGASSASTWSTDIFSAPYRAEYGQQIQAEVLSRIADQLRSRPRCRSMVVHRLFSDDQAEPPPTATTDSPHYQDGVYDSINGRPKLAVAALAEAWS